MFKFLRAFSPLRRRVSRPSTSVLSQNGQVNIQRVRFVRPAFTKKRIRRAFFTVAICTFLLAPIIPNEEEDKEESRASAVTVKDIPRSAVENVKGDKPDPTNEFDNQEGDGVENDNEESHPALTIPDSMPEDAIFIPLGFVHQRPPTFYKGNDPEWQAFVEFSKDRTKVQQIQIELASLVCDFVEKHPGFQRDLGTPIVPHKFWLDIDYPDGPPPEYERSGIEITEDYIALTTRPVSAKQYSRLQTILRPLPMLSAFWASYKVLWTLQWAKVKDFLKVDPKQENFTTNLSSSIFNLQQFANTSHKHESRSDSIAEETPVTKSKPSEYQSLINKKLSKVPLSSASSGSTKASSPVGDDMKAALKAFEHTLAKNWNQGHLQLERGTFLVSGLVEVVGFKAVCVLEVWAMYHPTEAKWGTLALGVRKMRRRNQKPRANFKAG